MKCPKLLQCCALSKSLLPFPAGFVHAHACPDEVRGNIHHPATLGADPAHREGRKRGRKGEPARRASTYSWRREKPQQMVAHQKQIKAAGTETRCGTEGRFRSETNCSQQSSGLVGKGETCAHFLLNTRKLKLYAPSLKGSDNLRSGAGRSRRRRDELPLRWRD